MQREWKILIGLVFLIVLFVLLAPKQGPRLDKVTIKQVILQDLSHKYPNANTSILKISKKTNKNNGTYYEVKAKVVLDYQTPCPKRMHIYYNYPKQNFVSQPPEYITKNCKVCVNEMCALFYPEEAVIASHTLPGTGYVSEFLTQNPNTQHTVSQILSGNNILWFVNWTSGNQSIGVQLYNNGTIEKIVR